jgi:predicted alpha/beta hydrolase
MRKEIKIINDERTVEMTVWSNPAANRVLVVAPGIGVHRQFYARLSDYFFHHGYSVILFDYAIVTNGKDRLADWGRKDITQVIEYAHQNFIGQDMFFLGHSMAGQLLPLASNHARLNAVFLIASQNVASRNWSGLSRLKLYVSWRIVIPIYLKIKGYLPGYTYGGYNLSAGIASDWREWGLSHEGILSSVEEAKKRYKNFHVPVRFISFANDYFAPPKSVEMMVESYGSTIKVHERFSAQELKIDGNIHFNFFRKDSSHNWTLMEEWFDQHRSVWEDVA